MPSWCLNRIKLDGSEESIKKLLDSVSYTEKDDNGQVSKIPGTLDFEKIIPIPEDIYMGDLTKEIRSKVGKKNWRDWCCENWNTKWNSCVCPYVNENMIEFKTAWNPPFPVIKKLSEMFPDIKITLYFIVESHAMYGIEEYLAGDCIHQERPSCEFLYEIFGIEEKNNV